jgi:hypothetical protein
MLTGVRHNSGTVAIVPIFILNMPFAIEKRISVSAPAKLIGDYFDNRLCGSVPLVSLCSTCQREKV